MIAAVWLMLSGLLYSLQLSTGSFPKPLTAEEERHYLTLSAQGDLQARNILIERNLRLVAHVVKKYQASEHDMDDLISVGTIGLIKAINTFKMDKGSRLGTYAAKCIENEILMLFRSNKKFSREVSLYEPIGVDKDGESVNLVDVIEMENREVLEDMILSQDIAELYEAVAGCLKDQERQVVEMRYGLYGRKPRTQREIADELGISRSYVSRIEKKALTRLKQQLTP